MYEQTCNSLLFQYFLLRKEQLINDRLRVSEDSWLKPQASDIRITYEYVLVCTHSYVLVCHPYVIRVCSYVIRMPLVCTRMSSHNGHPYVTPMWFYYEPFQKYPGSFAFQLFIILHFTRVIY